MGAAQLVSGVTMRRPALTVVAVLATLVGLCSFAPAASAADYAAAVAAVDSSTPGHVTATVTTDAPVVLVAVVDQSLGYDRAVAATRSLQVPDDHVVDVDLPTWGASGSTFLTVSPCATESSGCGVQERAAFTPTDALPEVTWPAQTAFGPGSTYQVTLADPAGDGSVLRTAYLHPPYDPWRGDAVARNGETEVELPIDGTWAIGLVRCSAETGACSTDPTVTSPEFTVNRSIDVYVAPVELPVSPHGNALSLDVRVDERGSLDVAWTIDGADAGSTVVEADSPATGRARFSLPIDLAGLADGPHDLELTVSKDTTDYGHLVGQARTRFRVDSVAPRMELKPTTTRLFPVRDGFNDSMIVRFSPLRGDFGIRTAQVLDASGNPVRTFGGPIKFHQLEWRGQDDADQALPGGRYQFVGVVADAAGNTTTDSFWFTLSRQRLVKRTFTTHLRPAKVLEDRSVGACSRLATPSARGGAGSLGFASNVTCGGGTTRRSIVGATFATRLPRAHEYDSLRLTTVGGAARTAPRSLAYIDVLDQHKHWDETDLRLSPRFGSHTGAYAQREFARPDRWLVWAAYTGGGASYDVQRFDVSVTYHALVGPAPAGARQPASRPTAASTRSSVAVNATRTWRPPALP